MARDDLLVLYSERGSSFYGELARRVRDALAETGHGTTLRSSREVSWREGAPTAGTVMVSGPAEFADEEEVRLLESLAGSRRRIGLFSEEVNGEGYLRHLASSAGFEAVFDLGFVSQEEGVSTGVPYSFVFDGPTVAQERAITGISPSKRPIPWALLGRLRGEEDAAVVAGLIETDPAGFVHLPPERLIGEGEEPLGRRALGAVASKTNYYIWLSKDGASYCDSGHYSKALTGGAAPCRIGEEPGSSGIPGAFGSVGELCAEIRAGGFEERYEAARAFWLSGGNLGEHLREALRGV